MTCAFALPIPALTTDRRALREPRDRATAVFDMTVGVWRHAGPDADVVRPGILARVETTGRRWEDAIKTSKRGD